MQYRETQENTELEFDDSLESTRSHNYSHDLSTSFPGLGNKEDDPGLGFQNVSLSHKKIGFKLLTRCFTFGCDGERIYKEATV